MGKCSISTDRSHDLKVSTGILSDYLVKAGYEIITPFKTNIPCLRRVMFFSNNIEEQASTLFVADLNQKLLPDKDGSSPFLLFLPYNEEAQSKPAEHPTLLRSKACVVRATQSTQSVETLMSDIQGCLLSVDEYAYKLALALSSTKPLQSLIDIAEKELGLFMSIVDSNYLLLAYTHNIKPIDKVNQSLVELGYHSDEMLVSQRCGDYLSEEIKYQTGIKEYPATESLPYALITAPLFLQQQYAGLVAMTSATNHFTTGQRDMFEMFISFCSMALKKKAGLSATQGNPDQRFLLHLISNEGLNSAYIRRQMTMLHIPVQGFYMMALIEIHRNVSSQTGFILNEIRALKNSYALPTLCDNTLVVLLNSPDSTQLAKSVDTLLESRAGEYLERIFESEVFEDFRSINVAYRSLLAARTYAPLTATPIWEEKRETQKVIPFAEVFTFAMIDPEGSADVKYFAASNTVIERILRSDAEKNSNDFELLAAYLSKGDKASRVADLFHLHRNGVAYRIERIQNQFGIDLNNPTIRNYVQMAIFCKITTDPECARKILEA